MFAFFTYVPLKNVILLATSSENRRTDTTSAAHLPLAMRGYTPQLAVQLSMRLQTTKQLWT